MSVKLTARLPDGDADGLQNVEKMLRQYREPVVAVVVLRPKSVADVLDRPDDPYTVTLAVRAIEVLIDHDANVAAGLYRAAYQARTGNVALPFEADW